ncbi:hypothetical protein [Streptomyces sp. B6B3]|uniref:hypothetical protein n=1 Tax=Streptomyces sp. B6B3 TaxID=3153570 RepID=UPI00325D9A8E
MSTVSQTPPEVAPENAPRPASIRFYGTSWVERSGGYLPRRVGLGLVALLLAAGAAGLLTFVYAGLSGSGTAGWLRALVVLALAMCTAMAFLRTWGGYTRPRGGAEVDESAFRSIKVVGCVGVFLAYALRTAVEAPGERLRRQEYDAAVERHRRLVAKRSRNPSRRGGKGGGRRS